MSNNNKFCIDCDKLCITSNSQPYCEKMEKLLDDFNYENCEHNINLSFNNNDISINNYNMNRFCCKTRTPGIYIKNIN